MVGRVDRVKEGGAEVAATEGVLPGGCVVSMVVGSNEVVGEVSGPVDRAGDVELEGGGVAYCVVGGNDGDGVALAPEVCVGSGVDSKKMYTGPPRLLSK